MPVVGFADDEGMEPEMIVAPLPENDGLSLEYKLLYGNAFGNLDFSNFVNNPLVSGVVWISGYSLQKQLTDLISGELRSLDDD